MIISQAVLLSVLVEDLVWGILLRKKEPDSICRVLIRCRYCASQQLRDTFQDKRANGFLLAKLPSIVGQAGTRSGRTSVETRRTFSLPVLRWSDRDNLRPA